VAQWPAIGWQSLAVTQGARPSRQVELVHSVSFAQLLPPIWQLPTETPPRHMTPLSQSMPTSVE